MFASTGRSTELHWRCVSGRFCVHCSWCALARLAVQNTRSKCVHHRGVARMATLLYEVSQKLPAPHKSGAGLPSCGVLQATEDRTASPSGHPGEVDISSVGAGAGGGWVGDIGGVQNDDDHTTFPIICVCCTTSFCYQALRYFWYFCSRIGMATVTVEELLQRLASLNINTPCHQHAPVETVEAMVRVGCTWWVTQRTRPGQ